MSARTLTFESFPSTTLTLLYFEHVTNGAEIKKKIVAKDVSVDAAFIDADMTPGPFLVHLAAYKALAAQVRSAPDDGSRLCTLLRACLPKSDVLLCAVGRVSSTSGCADPWWDRPSRVVQVHMRVENNAYLTSCSLMAAELLHTSRQHQRGLSVTRTCRKLGRW